MNPFFGVVYKYAPILTNVSTSDMNQIQNISLREKKSLIFLILDVSESLVVDFEIITNYHLKKLVFLIIILYIQFFASFFSLG